MRDIPGMSSGSVGVEKIPASIIKAICRVQSTLTAIKKGDRNSHGGYSFASTDAVYAALALKLANAGLAIIPLEDCEPEIKRIEVTDAKTGKAKVQQWGRFAFRFVLATEEDTWDDPRSRRCLFIQITGPQTFMAAQSYAEKAYLRSLFKLATGDMDLDSMPQETPAYEQEKPKRKSSAAAKRDGDNDSFNKLKASINEAPTTSDLRLLFQENASGNTPWHEFPSGWSKLLQEDFDARYEDLSAQEDAFA